MNDESVPRRNQTQADRGVNAQNDHQSSTDKGNNPHDNAKNRDEGPGCLPAIMAITVLVLMLAFITCGVSTWFLYQQRTELAVRTLQGFVIPEIEQSGLSPQEKGEVLAILRGVVEEAEAGKLENWQASGVMERLKRSPLMQWGDLAIAETLIAKSEGFTESEQADARLHLARLRRAAELGEAIDADFVDVLVPIIKTSDSTPEVRVNREATASQLREVVQRAKLVADRGKIPEEVFTVRLADIISREVRTGMQSGGL